MGQSYSLDLRARIVRHVRTGHSRREAARHFRVSASCAVKLLKRADRIGSVEPAHRGRPRGSGKLAAHQAFLIGRVEAQPDITMPELAAALAAERGVTASPASLSRVLCKAGFTYKKTADGVGARTRRRAGATTGVDREAPAPDAASAGAPGVHRRDRGQHQDDAAARAQPSRTALARFGAVRPLGHADLHRCAQVRRAHRALGGVDGAMDRAAFNAYVETQLAPTLRPGDVVIADNLSVHKSARAAQALKARGAWFLFLPQYSPDLNPIEMAFAKIKALLRKAATRTFEALWAALGDICALFSPDECWNFFKEAGYASG